jgi:carboxylesterase
MTRQPHLDPGPFFLDGGPVGALLIHGFTGAPPEMRLLGEHLKRRGFTVSAPLLPGHGTIVDDMNSTRWTDWTGHVERAYTDLRRHCASVFVGGLSMGALLALHLAVRHPDMPGVAALSPAVLVADRSIYLTPILKYFVSKRPGRPDSDLTDPEAEFRLWSYDETPVAAAHELLKLMIRVRRELPQVTCPLLVAHSTRDARIRRDSALVTYNRSGSRDKRLLTLHNSGHCITVDGEWQQVAGATADFFEARQPVFSDAASASAA